MGFLKETLVANDDRSPELGSVTDAEQSEGLPSYDTTKHKFILARLIHSERVVHLV